MSDSIEVMDMMPEEEQSVESTVALTEEVIDPINLDEIDDDDDDDDEDDESDEDIADLAVREYEEIVRDIRWIGYIVMKEVDGVKHVGKVVDFDHVDRWYKIAYENNEIEYVKVHKVIHYIAPPEIVVEYLKRAARAEKKKKSLEKRQKASTSYKRHAQGKRRAARARGRTRTSGGLTQRSNKYVPLAIKEKKKDCYKWY